MTAQRWTDALGALCGTLAPLLSFGGFSLIAFAGFAVQPEASVQDVAQVIAQPAPPIVFVGLALDVLGSVAFALFAARLWGTLRSAEAPPGWLSTAAFGAALLAVAASFVDKTIFSAIFLHAGGGIEPGVAAPLFAVASASFALFSTFAGVFIGLASVVALQTSVLPRWLGWLGLAVLALSLAGVALAEIGFLAFPLVLVWLIAASVLLLRRPLRQAR